MKISRVLLSRVTGSILVGSVLSLWAPSQARAQFANGADIGWLSQMEAQGKVFRDNSGVQKNCLDILKGKGINALRFRVWVNPAAGYCGKRDVAYMAHRADSAGFKVMLDFHLSDTWADPGHQAKPAGWAADSLSQLLAHLYGHIYGILDTLKSIGVVPKWVQIGNETNDGTLWEDGRATTHMNNFASIIKTGYNAVKASDSTIQVIVHLSDGHNNTMYRWMFDGLKSYGAKWDIIGMSVYPYWANMPWAKDDSLALINMTDMIARYQTKVMVVEAGYLYNDPVNAKNYLIDLITKTRSVGGLGVFYWEPESYSWQGYQLGAWDPGTQAPTAAMDAFLAVNSASESHGNNVLRYDLNVYPNPFNPSTTIEYDLPASSNVAIVIYNALGEEVSRLVNGYERGGHHNVVWSPRNVSSGLYICRMSSDSFVKTSKIVLLR